ncbi:MAG: M3 family metallopeptidase [Bacteroidales bacterium]|nr:M3 family metallopeptidase [Bacteroidales bacterium]
MKNTDRATETPTHYTEKSNPLLEQWNTPFGTPPFETIEHQHFRPALDQLMAEAREAIEAIDRQTAAPTLANTIVALEEATMALDNVSDLLFNLVECHSNDELQNLAMEMAPQLTRFSNELTMNEALFARVKALYDSREEQDYSPEELTVVEKYYHLFERGGVALDAQAKRRYCQAAEQLARLGEEFNRNVLADNNEWVLHLTDEEQLSGLPRMVVAAAEEEAHERGLEGWVFTLAYPSYGPFMTYADSRELREKMWRAYNSRGNRGNANDNNAIIQQMTTLRLQQAQLLGYDDYAHLKLVVTMAQDKHHVYDLLERLTRAALPAAKRDLEAVQRYATEHCGLNETLQRWDFAYYSEKLKQETYALDDELLRPYFPLEQVRQGIFGLYNTLYGLTFVENKKISVYHRDVRAYEVRDGERLMGVLYLDMFPRASKRSGAWMTTFRTQSNLNGRGIRPLVQVVCNFTKPTRELPSLLAFSEVETFMHEMGHAIHGLLSEVHYPLVSCTHVCRDFVEMPSQVMENWCYEETFLHRFARHYATGEAIPMEYIDRIRAAKNYLAGYLCLRQVNLGRTDMAYHTLQAPLAEGFRAEDFERSQMTELLPAVEGGNTSTAFTHIFAGGYAAGYYGYKWAEVLDADIFSKFHSEGIFNKATAALFRHEVLSRGGSEHPTILFRRFMGREPDPEALLRRCGLKVEA